jgi:hypothetical protein
LTTSRIAASELGGATSSTSGASLAAARIAAATSASPPLNSRWLTKAPEIS